MGDETVLTRGHRKKARTRQQLIDAGVRVLAARGEAMTVTDVVDEAGMSNGTFYNHFDDLDELSVDVARHLALSIATAISLAEFDDPARRFAAATARVLALARADPSWGRAVLRLVTAADDGDTLLVHARRNVAEGHRSGRFIVGPSDATMDQLAGLTIMSIRRIVHGRSTRRTDEEAIVRGLEALGISPDEARRLAVDATAGEVAR